MKSEKGQASVLIGMMMLTFIMFFAFVVNVGMLVNAKINLQNAADMAAYAGAAVQARQLNQISFLNYEMRRQYKKFLFRYYVMGNFAQKSSAQSTGHRVWTPDPNPQRGTAQDYKVPAVCMIFNGADNYCQMGDLPSISTGPKASPLDRIQQTLQQQLAELEEVRKENCNSIGWSNQMILNLWLWNADPSLENLVKNASDDPPTRLKSRLQVIKGLAFGLGVIPREILLRKRIDTLNKYLNFAAQSGVQKAGTDALGKTPDIAAHERTIQAYLSAYHTLGEHNFNSEEIVMDELLPQGTDAMLKLNDITVPFDAYSVDFKTKPAQNEVQASNAYRGPNDPAPCISAVIPLTIPKMPVGVYKDSSTLTYYAIKLTATAHVLFSPFGDMKMTAYAAAQPFGSRIGPVLTPEDFTRKAADTEACNALAQSLGVRCAGRVPNLPIKEKDSSQEGWDMADVLTAMFNQFSTPGQGNQPGKLPAVLTPEDMERAYQAAMVPNPWERGKYNIPNDFDDPFVSYFDAKGIYSFWAPIHEEGSVGGSVQDELQSMIKEMLDQKSVNSTGASNATANTANLQKFKESLQSLIAGYIEKMQTGQGEDGESVYLAKIANPMKTRITAQSTSSEPIKLDGSLFLNDRDGIKTSWNTAKDSAFTEKRRVGYSVKFVSFDTLRNPASATADGSKIWNRLFQGIDPESENDLTNIKH